MKAKRVFNQIAKVLVNIILVAGILYSTFWVVFKALPLDFQIQIANVLKTNIAELEKIGYGGFAGILVYFLKQITNSVNLALKDSDLERKLWEKQIKDELNSEKVIQDNRDKTIIERQNEIIAEQKNIQEQLKIVMLFNQANGYRNINSKVLPDEIKVKYKNAMDSLEELNSDIKPITTIYEEVIVKEIEPEETGGRL